MAAPGGHHDMMEASSDEDQSPSNQSRKRLLSGQIKGHVVVTEDDGGSEVDVTRASDADDNLLSQPDDEEPPPSTQQAFGLTSPLVGAGSIFAAEFASNSFQDLLVKIFEIANRLDHGGIRGWPLKRWLQWSSPVIASMTPHVLEEIIVGNLAKAVKKPGDVMDTMRHYKTYMQGRPGIYNIVFV
ncbi:uncharacterized protein K452DRAFT_302933 [Aplosporella prunicola CBS 121167]|uniref:Uncharacterized protein n=1 Tax=Aplosporella prunicola CBS 121167 TaxID=1176127 RepID=A0A6A6B0G3_9PEZI|nr:uncharacterized protein K452DRAFT_302933 [Aplosporella prunicola CBS 121167]KAF2136201.1 hypothetical protein K452DRAFT_302933 [Aplosporella prunicola CBS 121167]